MPPPVTIHPEQLLCALLLLLHHHAGRRSVPVSSPSLLPPPTACCVSEHLRGLQPLPEQLQPVQPIQCLLQGSRTSAQPITSQRGASSSPPTSVFPPCSVLSDGGRHHRAALSHQQDAPVLRAGRGSELAPGGEAGGHGEPKCVSSPGGTRRRVVCNHCAPEGRGSLRPAPQPSSHADGVSG